MLSPQQLEERAQDRRACSLSIKHALDIGSRKTAGAPRSPLQHSRTVTLSPGDACRAFSAAALAAGLPVLLNDVRRALLALQPQRAVPAAAMLRALALNMEGAGVVASMRIALQALQLPVEATADSGMDADSENETELLLENEAASLVLQAWQELCCAAVASSMDGCSSAQREAGDATP